MRLFPRRYPPPAEGFSDYWMKIRVILRDGAYEFEPDDPRMVAYFQVLGLRCKTGNHRETVESLVQDGTVDWANSEVALTNPNVHPRSTRRYFEKTDSAGFWHISGHIFYGPGEDDDTEIGAIE